MAFELRPPPRFPDEPSKLCLRRAVVSSFPQKDIPDSFKGSSGTGHLEEDVGLRIARCARDKATCVLKHEQELQKVISKYEHQLSLASETGQGARPVPQEKQMQLALQAEQQRCEDAEMAKAKAEEELVAAQAQVSKYKRKLQKLKAQSVQEDSRINELKGSERAARLQAMDIRGKSASEMFLLIAFRSWAKVVSDVQHETVLHAELDQAAMRTTAALSTLRSDLRCLRSCRQRVGRRAVEFRLRLSQAQAFAAWSRFTVATRPAARLAVVAAAPGLAREAQRGPSESCIKACQERAASALESARHRALCVRVLWSWCREASRSAAAARHQLQDEARLEEATFHSTRALSCARQELQQARRRAWRAAHAQVKGRVLLTMAAPFNAWARTTVDGKARSMRTNAKIAAADPPREVLLNSGEAAKRTAKQLEQERSAYCSRLETLSMQVSKASAIEAAMENLARIVATSDCAGFVFRSWSAVIKLSKAEASAQEREETIAAMRRMADEVAELHKVEIACIHGESRTALHEAWEAAAEASRKATYLECGLQAKHRMPLIARGMSSSVPNSRPQTALAIEQGLAQQDAWLYAQSRHAETAVAEQIASDSL
mmetsp:Transcript_5221/g.12583  ORF Transcript_5221/g.12583 Transcript_5221/m.12583 type:complete len:605 (-) Transcript_5221:12-1826(-)